MLLVCPDCILIFSVSFNKSFSLSSGSKIKPATMIATIIAKDTVEGPL